jgi:uncharacterized protein DUF6970
VNEVFLFINEMMIKLLSVIILTASLSQNNGCGTKEKSEAPSCIQQMIKDYENKPKQNPAATIYQYDYKGQKVYYVLAPCCDQMNIVYDSNCNIICHPDGGITGKGDGKCGDFNSSKTNPVLIWKDNR